MNNKISAVFDYLTINCIEIDIVLWGFVRMKEVASIQLFTL